MPTTYYLIRADDNLRQFLRQNIDTDMFSCSGLVTEWMLYHNVQPINEHISIFEAKKGRHVLSFYYPLFNARVISLLEFAAML